MKQKRFLIVHHFNCLNKGDASILKATVSMIKKRFPESEFKALSLYPEEDKRREKKIEFVNGIPATGKGFLQKPLTLAKMILFLLLVKSNATGLVSGKNRALVQAYEWAEVVISQSADCYTDSYGPIMSLVTLWQLEMAHSFRKPVYALGHTIGPFKKSAEGLLTKRLMKRALNKCKVVLAREKTSLGFLKEMHVKKPFVGLSADAAFALPSAEKRRANQIIKETGIRGEPKIGVIPSQIIYKYGFSWHKGKEKKYLAYKKVMKENIRFLAKEMNASVLLLAHSFGPPEAVNDQIVAGEVFRELKAEGLENIYLLEREHSPEEIKAVIGGMNAVISARTHAVIHAISHCVPALVIEYIHKGKGILSMLGLSKWSCSIEGLNIRELNSKSASLLKNRKRIKTQMKERVGKVHALAQQNAGILFTFLKREEIK